MASPAGVLLALALFAPALRATDGCVPDAAAATPAESAARERLWSLLTGPTPADAVRPTSPRYLALESRMTSEHGILLGWIMPGLPAQDECVLDAVTRTLGGEGGWLDARLVRTHKAARIGVWLERRDGVAWLGIEVGGFGRLASSDIELLVLETLAVLGAHAAPSSEPPGMLSAPNALSPAEVGGVVRRWLAPSVRAVVEVHRPDAPSGTRASRAPLRHVVTRGDTLTHIAERHGLDLDALVRLNGVDPTEPIHPGDELRLSDKRARRPKLYVVKTGDTLAKVARRFGVSESALLDMNRLAVRRVKVGQKLVLPP